ncbi:hypothetical protein HRbin06_00119 [archaeon HR06]|nr:hypothetical protein HRbin06_00119 [archaeon HR06]
MRIIKKEWFKLPRLGKEAFIQIMNMRVKYDKVKGFMVDDDTDLLSFSSFIKEILKEDLEVYLKCSLEGKVTPCDTCDYKPFCDRINVSSECLCDECYKNEEVFTLYSTNLASKIE